MKSRTGNRARPLSYEKREYDKAEHFLLKVIAQGGNRFADVTT